jgi:porin
MVYNVDGGISTGGAYAHQIELGIDVDWQRLADLNGLTTHTSLISRTGQNASKDFVGDTVLQAQEIYGSGFGVAAKLVWFYLEQSLLNGRLNIALGRLLPATDFNASPPFCNFMTLTICDHDRALTANQGFEDWPMSVWGVRVRIWPTEHTYVMVGAYQSQPYPSGTENYTQGGHTGFNWTWKGTTGASIPIELAWLPSLGPGRRPETVSPQRPRDSVGQTI